MIRFIDDCRIKCQQQAAYPKHVWVPTKFIWELYFASVLFFRFYSLIIRHTKWSTTELKRLWHLENWLTKWHNESKMERIATRYTPRMQFERNTFFNSRIQNRKRREETRQSQRYKAASSAVKKVHNRSIRQPRLRVNVRREVFEEEECGIRACENSHQMGTANEASLNACWMATSTRTAHVPHQCLSSTWSNGYKHDPNQDPQ